MAPLRQLNPRILSDSANFGQVSVPIAGGQYDSLSACLYTEEVERGSPVTWRGAVSAGNRDGVGVGRVFFFFNYFSFLA